MSDPTLLLLGIGVTFIFVAGVYVYVRERYDGGARDALRPSEPGRVVLRDARSET